MHDDGSGTVTVTIDLDADAVRAVERQGGVLEDEVRVADLPDAGWDVTWERSDDGGARLRLAKGFGRAEQLASVVEELDGRDGALHDVSVDRDASVLSTTFRFDGTADLAAIETGVTTDPELVASLTNERVDPAALDAQLLSQLRAAFRLSVAVSLPGQDTRTFTVEPGATVRLATDSSVPNWRRAGLLGAAAALALLAVVVLVVGRHNRRRAATS